MEFYNNTLAIEATWLIDEGIMTRKQYDHAVNRKQVNVICRGCRNTPAKVSYDSMPDRFKQAIRERVGGDPYRLAKVNQLEIRIEHDHEASIFFENYTLEDGRNLPKETRREYYANAVVLKAIHVLINDKRAKLSALGHRSKRAWDQLSDAAQELDRSKYPHTLPVNPRRLESKYKSYMQGGNESLIHKNFSNRNAARVASDVHESLLVEMIADPRNFDNAQIMREYNKVANAMQWQAITAATVANYRDKHFATTYAGRRGSVAYRNKITMQVKREAPSAPMLFWSVDGWDVELMYQIRTVDKKGHAVTTYHNRPTLIVLLDAFNKYPIGYAIGTQETPELIRGAFRNASNHVKKLLGKRYLTYQLQTDNYAKKTLEPMYEAMTKHYTPARVKNAKAKPIEPYFKYLNKTYCQVQPNWSGFGVTSDKDSQPNGEFLQEYKHQFPDWDGVVRQVIDMIEAERALKHDAFMVQWESASEDKKLIMPDENYLLTFGERRLKRDGKPETNMMSSNGMKVTINGIKRDYDCFDVRFRDYMSERWTIVYDPADVSKVLAVNEDETLRFVLEEKYIQPMALADREVGDGGHLQRVRDFNDSLEKIHADRRAKHLEDLQVIMPVIQRNSATLSKLMITDSNGQHKNQRNDGRGLPPNPLKGALKSRATDVDAEDVETDLFDRY